MSHFFMSAMAKISKSFILMLSQKFRRIDNESIAYLMQHSQIISEPQKLQLTSEQEIFIFRCRLL